jgi:predicted Rossmann fold flavoprotein
MLKCFESVRALSTLPWVIQPNAGEPRRIDNRTIYMNSPEYFTTYALRYANLGAKGIGGCCGIGPAEIKEMARSVRPLVRGNAAAAKPVIEIASGVEPMQEIPLAERSRLGRKLAATGNGQGNVSNVSLSSENYFSSDSKASARLQPLLQTYGVDAVKEFYASLGVLLLADERGRIYPAGRQASALSDALRFRVQEKGIDTRLGAFVIDVQKSKDGFIVTAKTADKQEQFFAQNVLLCTGGKAAKNFGTDGAGLDLIKKFGHTCTQLYPSLVQLKCDVSHTKTLKGIRVNDAYVTASIGGKNVASVTGDLIFTDYGVSGDAIFRISAFIADKLQQGVALSVDL